MMAATLLLAACSEAELADESISTPQGDMPVNLSFFAPTPDNGVATRSTISGTETAFTSVKMVCFASTGYFLGVREATATTWDSNKEGTLTGSVPSGTTSIHFIAGMGDVDPSKLVGLQERTAMHSSTTLFVSTTDDDMRYWGYYKATNANAMATWLNDSNHRLYLVRDRAQIVMQKASAVAATDISWTVVNGLEKGFIAPYSTTGSSPFVVTGDVPAPAVSTTPFATADRFDDRTWAALGASQFIFDDRNETGTGKTPLIILMRAKFSGSADYKYFKVMLEDNLYRQIRVTRNHRYTLTINDLEARAGYDTEEEALAGDFANGFLKSVDEDVPTINYKGHRLIIDEEKGTKVMFQSGTTGVVHFQFLNDDGTPVAEAQASDFAAEWLEEDAIDDDVTTVYSNTDIGIAYDNTTGNGTLTLNLNTIDATLKKGRLQLVYKEGHIRYVTVYTHTPYQITMGGSQGWSTTTHGSKKAHKFEFTVPSDFPSDFYPIVIYYTSITSEPYNDQAGSNSTEDYSKFSIIVESTEECRQNAGDASWNYNAKLWGYWFEYELQSYPTGGKVTFYMDDTRVERGKSSTNYVGGFLKIPYFELPTETSGELSGYRYSYPYSNLP